MSRRIVSGVAAAIVIALVLGGFLAFRGGGNDMKLTAYFSRAVQLYPGNDVRILGIPVGTITSIEPDGTRVKVEMTYDAQYKVPADASAVIVPPTIVSDRYVQLTPVYRSGPELESGTVLGTDRTQVPLELDQIFGNLNDLNKALGPEGANKNGALADLLKVSAQNLDGNGDRLHDTLMDFSQAVQTLDENSGDLFGTIQNLSVFTAAIKESDAGVRQVNANLADVSTQLNGERDELATALAQLAQALGDISGFVKDNRGALKANIDDLTSVTQTILSQRRALEELLDVAPVALANLSGAYNAEYGTLDTRADVDESLNPDNIICALAASAGGTQATCDELTGLLNGLSSGGVPGLPPVPAVNGSSTPSAPDLTLGGILGGAR